MKEFEPRLRVPSAPFDPQLLIFQRLCEPSLPLSSEGEPGQNQNYCDYPDSLVGRTLFSGLRRIDIGLNLFENK